MLQIQFISTSSEIGVTVNVTEHFWWLVNIASGNGLSQCGPKSMSLYGDITININVLLVVLSMWGSSLINHDNPCSPLHIFINIKSLLGYCTCINLALTNHEYSRLWSRRLIKGYGLVWWNPDILVPGNLQTQPQPNLPTSQHTLPHTYLYK